MSWLWRGFQSAVFYYLSCAPCSTFAHQRKRQRANRRARTEKGALEEVDAAAGGVYQHPSPFSTNVYWQEEMVMGPGPPLKRGAKDKDKGKSDSMKRLHSGGPGSSAGASSADTAPTAAPSVIVRSSGRPSSVEAGAEGWNCRRYQRPDEALWGYDDLPSQSAESFGMSTVGPRSTHSLRASPAARNPTVNDMLLPVVSTPPTSRQELRWMLQPPPSAKVMAGTAPANRSRSTTSSTGRPPSQQQKEEPLSLAHTQSPHVSVAENKASQAWRSTRPEPAGEQKENKRGTGDMDESSPRKEASGAGATAGDDSHSSHPKHPKHRPVLSPINSFHQNIAASSARSPSSQVPVGEHEPALDPLTGVSTASSLRALETLVPSISAVADGQDKPFKEKNDWLPPADIVDKLDLAIPHLDP